MRMFIVVVGVLAAHQAFACGGLFCSQVSPTPVDQRAERILFEILGDGTVAATVEIRYEGDPRAFSWIVPVSGTPDFVGVAPKDTLQLLDAATQVSITPPQTICTNPPFQMPSFGCADALGNAPIADVGVGAGGAGGVNVTAYPSVGPFDDIVVVEGTDPTVLMQWLTDHEFQVNDQMRPFIEQYTVEGYKFLATKLQASADVKDMVPIRFHCPQPFPEIPLRLTAIAAEPEMGFTVFVAGPQRYTLSGNYSEVALATDDLQTGGGVTNYFALVSKRIDDAGGLGFVVERAQPSATVSALVANTFLGTDTEADARTNLDGIFSTRAFVTRFYGRMDPEEMIEDPQFVPGNGGGFDGTFDLSGRTVEACPATGAPPAPVGPPACGTLYCGSGDACATSDLGDGCVCRNGHLARTINAPGGGLQVVCTSPAIDLHAGTNACATTNCGAAGTCVPVNDRPTCACADGNVAVVDGAAVTCAPIKGPVFESDQILWPAPPKDLPAPAGGCGAAHVGGAASIALWFGAVAVVRRVLRRR